jgi:hypothetical protein
VTWLKIHDGLPFDPKVLSLGKTKAEINEAIGMATRIWAWCGQQRTDGFVPAAVVDAIGTPACTKRLTRPVFGRKAFLHRRAEGAGAECECLRGRPWPADADFLVHDFLDRNPSRAENDVAKAKRKERDDPQLKAAVRRRDGDRCRYCGIRVNWADKKSPHRPVLDHVDPALAKGADNLVVACKSCNSKKGHRTPEQADMPLLPLPTAIRSAQNQDEITDRIKAESLIGPRSDHRSGSDPPPDPDGPATEVLPARSASHGTVKAPTGGPNQRSPTPGTGRDGTAGRSVSGPPVAAAGYAGPEGERPTVGPASTTRGQLDSNPYLKTWPSPDTYAGPIPEWPPGSEVDGALALTPAERQQRDPWTG